MITDDDAVQLIVELRFDGVLLVVGAGVKRRLGGGCLQRFVQVKRGVVRGCGQVVLIKIAN